MNIRKRRDESKQIAVIVLEGTKVSTENTSGLAPLCLAMRQVVNPNDEIIVFTLLRVKTSSAGEEDSYVRLLHEEISERKEVYLKIFRPFYYSCKDNGVKFQLKIAAGFRPKDIIVEEANNVNATWIVVDRCFARHLPLKLSGTNCNISLISDIEETMSKHYLPTNEQPESSSTREVPRSPKSPKLRKGPISPGSTLNTFFRPPLEIPTPTTSCQTCTDNVPPARAIPPDSSPIEPKKPDHISTNVQTLPQRPLQLMWDAIEEMTDGFKSRICDGQRRNHMLFYGYLEDQQSLVLVRKYSGDSCNILEAEMKAAMLLKHKNVHTLIGYHKSDEHGIVLVFPLQSNGTLKKHISDLSRIQCELGFKDKMKIAIGIAQGIRYLHEECIGGPVAHARLRPCNILLTSDLQPMISGFEHATWLQFRQELPASRNRDQNENSSEQRSMVLIKSDIFSFGVMLLRLFCRKSVPQNDESLVEWARPLLIDRAFHMLLEDENSEDMDMHELFRVMAAARMCIMSKPILRPSISKVISTLKGDNFCIIQPSPSISENSAKIYEDANL